MQDQHHRFAASLLALCGALLAGCEQQNDDGTAFLTVDPSSITIGTNVTWISLAVGRTRDLSLPLAWSVSSPGLGAILGPTAGTNAVYRRTAATGVNTITVRDQYGAEGYAHVSQVDYYVATGGTNGTTDGTSTNGICDRLRVSEGNPFIAPDCASYTFETSNITYDSLSQVTGYNFQIACTGSSDVYAGTIRNIRRNSSGDTTAYDATINGVSCSYP